MLISGCGGEQLQGSNNVVEHLTDDRSTKSDVDNVEISDGGQSNVEKEQSKAHSGYNRQKNNDTDKIMMIMTIMIIMI